MSSQVWILDKWVFFFLVEIFPKYWKGQTCTQKVFAVYLKFGCEEASCIYLATSLETLLPAGSVAKNHLLVQEMWVRTLGKEDSLEEELAAHSSIAAWRNPWTEEPGGLQSMGLPRVRHNWGSKQQQQQLPGITFPSSLAWLSLCPLSLQIL